MKVRDKAWVRRRAARREEALEQTRELYGNLRSYTEHEDNLISQRLTWLLTVQGFMFAAYGLSIGTVANNAYKIFDRPIEHGRQLFIADTMLFALGLVVALMAIYVTFKIQGSIAAARSALDGLLLQWEDPRPAADGLPPLEEKGQLFHRPRHGRFPYLHGGGHIGKALADDNKPPKPEAKLPKMGSNETAAASKRGFAGEALCGILAAMWTVIFACHCIAAGFYLTASRPTLSKAPAPATGLTCNVAVTTAPDGKTKAGCTPAK